MSEAVEWGVHCCSLLTHLSGDETLRGAELAAFFELPPAYLSKHLRSLARAGVLEATSGPGGGYRLAKPPQEVSLLDVVRAIEGAESTFRCTEIRQRGPSGVSAASYRRPCGIATAMWRAEAAWEAELTRTSIADVSSMGNREVSAEQRRLAATWIRATARRRVQKRYLSAAE